MLFRKKKQQDPAQVPEDNAPTKTAAAVERTEDAGIPGDIVAAITAAVAAASNLSPSAFRIASIGLAECDGGFNTPVWGRVERLTRK